MKVTSQSQVRIQPSSTLLQCHNQTILVKVSQGFTSNQFMFLFKSLLLHSSERCHRRVVNAKVVTTVSNVHECLRPSSSLLPCSTKTKEPPNGTVAVGFWFRRTDIKVISRVLKIDWTTLTANIGGAMGLYLGWGLLDIVLKMYHYLIKLIVFLSRYFLKPPIDLD